MTFYTTLILTYVIGGVELSNDTMYRSAMECGNALPAAYEPYAHLDSMAQCIETNYVSSASISIKPTLRPKGLNNGG